MQHDWGRWGHLAERYRVPGPRRMLALDGGGIRGLVALETLRRLEELLAERFAAGGEFRLCQFFDYIGGTSTGALIAACLARGLAVREIQAFYAGFAQEVFRRRRVYERWRSMYRRDPLAGLLRGTFGEGTTLEPQHLRTLLLVVTRNATTDSVWPVSSNPSALHNDPEHRACNLRVPLWQLLRASTAAPYYFLPEVIQWDPVDPRCRFAFADGGTSACNNPAFLMARMAMEPAYRLAWPRGERDLLLVSVGTAAAPAASPTRRGNVASALHQTLRALFAQAAFDQDLSCRTVGRCAAGPPLDEEVGDCIPRDEAGEALPLAHDQGRAFLYVRYDEELSARGLARLGLAGQIAASRVAALDAIEHAAELTRVGRAIAQRVDLAHFGAFADPARAPLARA